MGNIPIYTDDHLRFIKRRYLADGMHPRQLAPIVNAEFGTNFTIEQIRNLVRDRHWTKQRKERLARLPSTESLLAEAEKKELAKVKEDVEAFLAQCSQIGQEAIDKAQGFIRSASTAKTLGSAVGAARAAIGIKREAIGLDSTGSRSGGATFNFNFAKIDNSPFNPKPITQAPAVEMLVDDRPE